MKYVKKSAIGGNGLFAPSSANSEMKLKEASFRGFSCVLNFPDLRRSEWEIINTTINRLSHVLRSYHIAQSPQYDTYTCQ